MPSQKLVHALPVDIFRILAGLLCLLYFVTLGLDAKDFSASTGLINHQLSYELFRFTQLGLFHGTLPASFFYMVYGAAALVQYDGNGEVSEIGGQIEFTRL